MVDIIRRRIVALFVALGLVMGGVAPSMAGPAAATPCAMMKMADMAIHARPAAVEKRAPIKAMLCDGVGCGCCVAGACAMPAIQADSPLPAFQGGKIAFGNMGQDGISHPPVVRPPISLA